MFFKVLFTIFLIGYIFLTVGRFIARIFLSRVVKSAQQQQAKNQQYKRSERDGVNIEFMPKNDSKRSGANFKGGEYVDYEEIK